MRAEAHAAPNPEEWAGRLAGDSPSGPFKGSLGAQETLAGAGQRGKEAGGRGCAAALCPLRGHPLAARLCPLVPPLRSPLSPPPGAAEASPL